MSSLTLPGWLTPRPYQTEAVEAWKTGQGQGILNMATGTGKTITALVAATELYELQGDRLALIVAAPYTHLVDQWTADLEAFGAIPFRAYGSRTTWTDQVTAAITEFAGGVRDLITIVTTQATFSTDHFQGLLERLDGSRTLLIADEVHHMGAPHMRQNLPGEIRARLGLSATPERWYDEEGTGALMSYFSSGIVFEYGISEAIANGYLSKYYYVPHIVELTADEAESYYAISRAIVRLLDDEDGEEGGGGGMSLQDNEQLKQLLIRRSRLIGTARNKIEILRELLTEIGPSNLIHSLVYCGDGSLEVDDEGSSDIKETQTDPDVKRQLRIVTELLGRELGVRAHQFTYEENEATRERLLRDFEEGELQALVAIRCLDEGVDVPATKSAFMMASSSNPRQFVQRRGRILRPHKDKRHSTIHDFIVAPPAPLEDNGLDTFSVERNLLRRQLQRVETFTNNAINHPDAELGGIPTTQGSLRDLKRNFNLLDM
jgi:superfamily II DNA or RNA helicase